MPEVNFAPPHPPDAVQAVAFVLDHVKVLDPLYAMLAVLALNVTVGMGAATLTVTLWLAVPPAPLHASV